MLLGLSHLLLVLVLLCSGLSLLIRNLVLILSLLIGSLLLLVSELLLILGYLPLLLLHGMLVLLHLSLHLCVLCGLSLLGLLLGSWVMGVWCLVLVVGVHHWTVLVWLLCADVSLRGMARLMSVMTRPRRVAMVVRVLRSHISILVVTVNLRFKRYLNPVIVFKN